MKILATPRSFGKYDCEPIETLKKAGCEVILNPFGRILTKEEMCSFIEDVDGLIIGLDPLDKEVLNCARNLKVISKYGVGTDNIDLDWAREHNIPVTLALGANSNAVADHTIALMFACARRITEINALCRNGDWTKREAVDIFGKKIGILGLGSIGKDIALRASGFNMQIYAFDEIWDTEFCDKYNIHFANPEDIYKECDFITVHLPCTDETQNMIGYDQFKQMKSKAVFVNTANGGLVDEDGLVRALKENLIFAAGIDMFKTEPPENKDLYKLNNLIMTSHCSASTYEAAIQMGKISVKNLLGKLFPDQNKKST